MNKCAVCGEDANVICESCEFIYYCSVQHRMDDWKIHQNSCKAFKISRRTKKFQCSYLTSTRQLKCGKLVFTEEPLVTLPKIDQLPICLGCSEFASGDVRCETCGWPVCSSSCASISNHQPECLILRKRNLSDVEVSGLPYKLIPMFRCMGLKILQPQVWEVLTSMLNGKLWYLTSKKYHEDVKHTLPILRTFVTSEEFSDECVLNLCLLLRRSIFGSDLCAFNNPYKERNLKNSFIYRFASLLDHNCVPNCFIDIQPRGIIAVTTLRQISTFDKFSITYVDPFLGTKNRRKRLRKNRFIYCNCERCLDDYELLSYMRSFICPRCRLGRLVPYSVGDRDEKVWKCGMCSCVEANSVIKEKTAVFRKYLDGLKDATLDECKEFLTAAKRHLHFNHEIIIATEVLICKKYEETYGSADQMPPEQLESSNALFRHLISVHEILIPGIIHIPEYRICKRYIDDAEGRTSIRSV